MASSTSISSKATAYALLAMVGTVVLYLFGFRIILDNVRVASQERASNEAKIAGLQQKISDLRSLAQQFIEQRQQVDVLSVAMPADRQIAEVVSMFETMTARAGLTLDNIQPATPTEEGLPVTVSVRGSFAGVLTFAELMEKNVRPIRIGPINMSAGDTELAATFTVVAVYQVPPEDLPQSTIIPEDGSSP
jgi:Tfp pilus assembly protein PilO